MIPRVAFWEKAVSMVDSFVIWKAVIDQLLTAGYCSPGRLLVILSFTIDVIVKLINENKKFEADRIYRHMLVLVQRHSDLLDL